MVTSPDRGSGQPVAVPAPESCGCLLAAIPRHAPAAGLATVLPGPVWMAVLILNREPPTLVVFDPSTPRSTQ